MSEGDLLGRLDAALASANGPLTALPKRPDDQHLIAVLAASRFEVGQTYLEGEVNGRLDTRDDEPSRPSTTRGAVRLGARYTVGGWRGDVAAVIGLTARDAGIGFAAGFTYVFTAFQIP